MTANPAPRPAQPSDRSVETNPFGNLLCFVVVAVPTWQICGLGAYGLGSRLDSTAATVALAVLTLGLGAAMGGLVVQWRARANPRAWHHALFVAVAVFGGAMFALPPNPMNAEMWLTIHLSGSDYFGQRAEPAEPVAVGDVVAFGGDESTVPPGWMIADGQALARAEFPELGKRFGDAFGGDEATVRLPRLGSAYGADLEKFYRESDRAPDEREPRRFVIETRLSAAAPPEADEEERARGRVLWLVCVRPAQ